jgi:hypothetical protein
MSERLWDPSFAKEASNPPAARRRPSGESATALTLPPFSGPIGRRMIRSSLP